MRDNKKSKSRKTPEQEALEKHVDAMMDPKRPDEAAVTAVAAKGPTTAPQLSAKLRKQAAASETSAKPLSIDKLDELAAQITKPDPPATPEKDNALTEAAEEPAPQVDPAEKSTELDDSRTDEAVDDIVAYEGDVMLAVADSTAEERNRQAVEVNKPKGHPVLSMITWTFVAILVILIVAFGVLLLLGDNLANKLGL